MQTKEQKQERPGIKAVETITWLCTCSGCLWIMIMYKNYITLTALSLISCWKASFSFLNEVRYFCEDSRDKHTTIADHCMQERSYQPIYLFFHWTFIKKKIHSHRHSRIGSFEDLYRNDRLMTEWITSRATAYLHLSDKLDISIVHDNVPWSQLPQHLCKVVRITVCAENVI